MGLSTYQPERRLTDWPADVERLIEALGIGRFAVMGWSAGGPYAAVCAAKMGGRVTAAALLSSAVPLDLYGTTRGLTAEDRVLLAPDTTRAAAGLRRHEGEHRERQQRAAVPGRHAFVPGGRPDDPRRVGPSRPRPLLRP